MRRAASWACDPLLILGDWVWVWVALGWPLGHPRATQAWRKGGPRVEWNKWFCLQQKLKKWRVGVGRLRRFRSFISGTSRSFRMTVCSAANLRRAALLIAEIAEIADIVRDRKGKTLPLINADERGSEQKQGFTAGGGGATRVSQDQQHEIVTTCNVWPKAKSPKPSANCQLLFANCYLLPHGCPTTTIDSGPPPVEEVEIKAVVTLAEVMFAFKTDTVFDPLFAT